ncbi:hypothetical protein [Oceanobacter mangrovi]|uniref:hypothetical protein n=1 Tax=Oceanobacter mangrovi TaxID=2862510 RepID=UPI001C8D5046|nr:hypothetical protein [Oceanobacter mangrovi]
MTDLWPLERPLEDKTRRVLASNRSALQDLPEPWLRQWDSVWLPVACWVAQQKLQIGGVPIFGIHGGQGSGKSTLSQGLAKLFRAALGWNCVVVSIDDLYLSHAERQQLSQTVHPLLATRGVPGTHDAELGQQLFQQLKNLHPGDLLAMPAFDKASDDRLPRSQWHQCVGPVDLILFEGWCVGCEAASDASLQTPVNELEASEDADGHWRQWVNQHLQTDYKAWFAMLDRLIMLKVPGMNAVLEWRGQQEQENRRNAKGADDRSMDQAALIRFIQHYQRLTENALQNLPASADLVLELNSAHAVHKIL